MKTRFNIWLLLVALLFSSSISAKAMSTLLKSTPEIEQALEEYQPTALPAPQSGLTIPTPGESGINILEQLLDSNAEEEAGQDGNRQLITEYYTACNTKIQLRISPAVYFGLIVEKIIYPFHSHW